MRIRVDRDLCQGHGVCEAEAPTVFEVPKVGQVNVLDESPPEDEREHVEAAVKFCPTHALSIEEPPPDPAHPPTSGPEGTD